jgi:hypothetical protein
MRRVKRRIKQGKAKPGAPPGISDRVARLTTQFIDKYRDVLRRLA